MSDNRSVNDAADDDDGSEISNDHEHDDDNEDDHDEYSDLSFTLKDLIEDDVLESDTHQGYIRLRDLLVQGEYDEYD
jgi:hypothetical protein